MAVTADYAGEYAARTYDTYPETTAYLRAGLLLGKLPFLASLGLGVVDVGYGNGSFLKVMRKAGCSVYGIDVHGRDHGIEEVTFSTNKAFALATYFDSLEHLPDLTQPLLLKAQHVAVSIPTRPDWFVVDPQAWRHFKPGEHLHYFSPTSLRALWQRAGYFIDAIHTHEDITRGHLPGRKPEHPSTTNISSYLFAR